MARRPTAARLTILGALGLALVGCGSTGTSSAPSGGGATGAVAVSLKEWSVTPAPATTGAGSVTFTVTNEGTTIHEFVVVQTEMAADAIPVVDNKVDESALTPIDEIEDIAVGAAPALTVDLTAGHYVLLCNIESHYEQGMRADFVVD